MKKIIILLAMVSLNILNTHALSPKETQVFFNGPSVKNISKNSAEIYLKPEVLNSLTEDEKKNVYFEYFETQQVCIMIYPTPENCLPKKTAKSILNPILNNLKTNTEYSVQYKIDTNIVCIKAPCPTNEFSSLTTTFKTKNENYQIERSLYLGNSGQDVKTLQEKLIEKGYMRGVTTGYFGIVTLKAVKNFQKNFMKIYPIGIVGPKTKAALYAEVSEKFSGKLEKVSTACFADGVCSATIDGKEVVVTTGWRQGVLGSLKGFESIADMEKYIGRNVNVYAKKTMEGYTLYGDSEYYIDLIK